MSVRNACVAFAGLLGSTCAILPASSWADTIYTYTEGSGSDIVPSFSFTTSLTGAALDDLAAGTDITSTVTAFTFDPGDVPSQDNLGFQIGGGFGSSYFNASTATVEIGTDSLGQITSYDIYETVFASYPAVSGESPSDFYCDYTASTTSGGDSLTLTADHDAGLCPGGTTSGTGTFGAVSVTSAPEPASAFLLGSGLLGLLGLTARRKRIVRETAT